MHKYRATHTAKSMSLYPKCDQARCESAAYLIGPVLSIAHLCLSNQLAMRRKRSTRWSGFPLRLMPCDSFG
jgi:hypothetical protein